MELLVPEVRAPVLPMPSYVKLAMAFGVGAGAQLFDKSRYRSHGAITGAVWAAGLHGRCLDFVAATPSFVVIPASYSQLNFTSEDFSMIARLKVDLAVGVDAIINRGEWKVSGWSFYIWTEGRFGLDTDQTGANQLTYSATGLWSFGDNITLGFSRSGPAVTLYLNGVTVSQTSGDHIDPQSVSRETVIGSSSIDHGANYDGKMEFLRVFGGIALSASEHLAWHNALK